MRLDCEDIGVRDGLRNKGFVEAADNGVSAAAHVNQLASHDALKAQRAVFDKLVAHGGIDFFIDGEHGSLLNAVGEVRRYSGVQS